MEQLPRFQSIRSTGRPIGRLVMAAGGQLVRLGTVGEHGPNLSRAVTCGLKNKVASIRRPTGTLVAALIAGQLHELPGSRVHDVDIVVVVRTAPTEGQQLAVGRPGRID